MTTSDSPSAQPDVTADEAPLEQELQTQLAGELDEMIERVQQATPGYTPPPFSPQALLDLLRRNMDRFSPQALAGLLNNLRAGLNSDLFDMDTWRGIWYVVNYSLESQADLVKRRMNGAYETDEWGYDPEVLAAVKPFFEFLYTRYWRVTTSGLENIPDAGRAILVSNHSGQLPWDGAMLGVAVMNEHPAQRLVRTLYGDWFPTLPFVSALFTKCGQALASEENGIRLLEDEQLVAIFPEGYKGVGKLFKDRYRLARFGRGGFVRMALITGAPIIPVAIVGAEETYISLAKSPTLARLTGFPYFPISPTFPWLGPLGFVPLPTKWTIQIGEPIPVDVYGAQAADNPMLVSQITDQTRNIIQKLIHTRLAERQSIFTG